MNRKQKKLKRNKATQHKIRCKHLKGGDPREWRHQRGRLWYRLRASRKRLHRLSLTTMRCYMEKYGVSSKDTVSYLDL